MIFSLTWLDQPFSYPASPNSPAITQIRGARARTTGAADLVLEDISDRNPVFPLVGFSTKSDSYPVLLNGWIRSRCLKIHNPFEFYEVRFGFIFFSTVGSGSGLFQPGFGHF